MLMDIRCPASLRHICFLRLSKLKFVIDRILIISLAKYSSKFTEYTREGFQKKCFENYQVFKLYHIATHDFRLREQFNLVQF